MRLIDLSRAADQRSFDDSHSYSVDNHEVALKSANCRYTGLVHKLTLSSMTGSYIDFPGHIKETDNGLDAKNFPPEKLYRIPCRTIHLDRPDRSGGITAEDLRQAAGGDIKTPFLVINALGSRHFWEIEQRTVWLTMDAVDWIISTGCRYLLSDVYESTSLDGVFLKLFGAGICTVCEPGVLAPLPETALISVIFFPIPSVKQIPCRILAEVEE